jgi:hypothetical protein
MNIMGMLMWSAVVKEVRMYVFVLCVYLFGCMMYEYIYKYLYVYVYIYMNIFKQYEYTYSR